MTVDIEFLIQKEGDFAWLPLESLSVEILVGRYQLIAQTSEADCPIQVHIHHQYVEDGLWQEVVQHQLFHTDSQGRIEVLPPTFLQHGRWIISCAANEDEQLANSEIDRHCVQLQVLEQETDLDQDWEFLSHSMACQESNGQQADLLAPLQAANIRAKTAWNNIAPPEESISIPEEEFNLEESIPIPGQEPEETSSISPTLFNIYEPARAANNPEGQPSQDSRPESTVPQLPEIPHDITPIRLQISPGLILPPELFTPETDNIPIPQLPEFPHLNQWKDLSYSELSVALGRLHWSKLDTYGEAIDVDFGALELQERFLATLTQLSTQKTVNPNNGTSITPEKETQSNSKALVPIASEGAS
ncbi:hypothetical protein [Acaryochloris marina]|uniref:Uncharacterized protein n=1 Tax=Acaryochloris marina (strain MBIC 11017) TaxID=329726 RepID=B0CD99_ACAM1|nr:hypothetical protein [Acaryochloris marina]ABW25690.1 hypothetical protein AM1_0641 [Acaryochloris marina MBIC11017]BDM80563.1 hypothetical protein AM10699_34310 [Acaryochloris marina MBIC10699]